MEPQNTKAALKNKVFDLSRQGHALLKVGRYAESCALFAEALALGTTNAHVLTGMGDALRRQKDLSGAAVYYRQVLKNDPRNIFSLRGLGDALRGLGQFQEAIDLWEKYLRLQRFNDIFVLTRIADSYKALDAYDQALTYYRKALAIGPNDRYALMGLADLYHKHGQEQSAIEYYEKALANGVTLITILTIVGNLYWRREEYEKAREYYEKALQQDPDNAYALYGLGNYFRWQCDYQRAVEVWERILTQGPGTVTLLVRLGDAYRNLGQLEAAERSYRKNLDSAYDLYSLIGMLKIHCLQGRAAAACQCYDELLRNEGDDVTFLPNVAKLLLLQKDGDVARSFFLHVKQCRHTFSGDSQLLDTYLGQLDTSGR